MKRCLFLLLCLSVFAPTTFAQDDCTTAIAVGDGINPNPPGGTSGTFYDNTGMTTSANLHSCGLNPNDDIWFVYTATASGAATFSTCTPAGFIVGSHQDTVLSVWDGSSCPPTLELGCGDDAGCNPSFNSTAIANVTIGSTYFVQVSTWDTMSEGTFYLTVTPPPPPGGPGDDCSTAIAVGDGINPGPPTGTSGVFYDNTGMTINFPQSSCGFGPSSDMWFVYTATTTGATTFSTDTPAGFVVGSHQDTILSVWDSSSCPPTTEIGCDDDGGTNPGFSSTLLVATTAGTTYFVSVSTFSGNSDGTFYLSITPPGPPAGPGDDCTVAIPIADGINPSPPAGSSGTFYDNTGMQTNLPQSSCGLAPNADIWFVYTAGINGSVIFSTCTPGGFALGSHTDTVLSAWDGSSCPPTTELGCADDAGCNPTFASTLTVPVTAGSTYFVSVSTWDSATPEGTFYLSVTPVLPPTNDDCVSAIPIFDGVNPNPPAGVSGQTYSNIGATNSVGSPAPSCSLTLQASDDVWFSYTALASGNITFSTCTPAGLSPGTHTDTVIQILDGSTGCPPLVEVGCNDDAGCSPIFTSAATANLTAGTTYFVRVFSFSATYPDGTFYVSVQPPPPNDDCAGAIPLAFGPNGPYDNTFATDGAAPAQSCNPLGGGFKDLWFSYTATCPVVSIDTCSPAGTLPQGDTTVSVYDACGGLEIACNDDACGAFGFASSLQFSATVGSTYFVRVASWGGATGTFPVNVGSGTAFTLTFSNPPPPAGFASIQIDWDAGPPNGTAALVLTFTQGLFPAGWFFGIDATFAEVSVFLSDPAFNMFPLDSCGHFTLGPFFVPNPGFPFNNIPFYGVSFGTPPAAAVPTVVSNPASGVIQ